MMSLLGYCEENETILTRPGDASAAKVAIAEAQEGIVGRGINAGRFLAKIRGQRVIVALFTPQNRSWQAPLLEGIVEDQKRGFAVLRGRFRWTYPQMVSMAMFQIGVVLFSAEGLITGAYRGLGLNTITASLVALLIVLAVAFLPRLAWKTRAWKKAAVIEYLSSCGFAAGDRGNESARQ